MEDALETINYYIELNPDDENGYVYRASIHVSQGNYTDALNDYDRALEINTNNPYSYAGIAWINSVLKDQINAKINVNKACKLISKDDDFLPEMVLLYYSIAFVYFNLQDYKNARFYCDKILLKYDKHIAALLMLAEIEINTGNLTEANKCYEKAFNCNPDNKLVYINWCNFLIDTKSFEEAIKLASEAIKKFGDFTEAYSLLGLASLKKSASKMALYYFNKAIELSPSNPLLYYFRGFAAQNAKLYQQAIVDWEYAITLDFKYEKELRPLIKAAANDINPSIVRKIIRFFKFIGKLIVVPIYLITNRK